MSDAKEPTLRRDRGVVVFIEEQGETVQLRFDDVTREDHSTWTRSFAYTTIAINPAQDDLGELPKAELEMIGFAVAARLTALRKLSRG